MTLNANAVRVAGTGEVFIAPAGTAAPTDPTTALPAAWKGLGITTTDGVQFTMSRDTTDLDGWQQSKIRVVTNSEPVTIEFALMETTGDTLKAAFGGGTVAAGTPIGTFTYTPPAEGVTTISSAVVDFADGTLHYRYYFPRVQLEGDVSFSLTRSDAVAYSVTLGVLANTPKWMLFTDDTAVGPAGTME